MTTLVSGTVVLQQMTCKCGGVWGCNEAFLTLISEEGGYFHCPYCQTGRGWAKGRLQREKESHAAEKAALEARLRDASWHKDRAEAEALKAKRANARTEAEMRRQKVRIHNGVCPCCNRTFVRLGMHMAKQHPDYLK